MLIILLGAGAVEGGLSESSLNDFYGKLRSFRDCLELDFSQWPQEEEEVRRTELHWFLTQQENQDLIMSGLRQLGDCRQTLIQCSHKSIGARD